MKSKSSKTKKRVFLKKSIREILYSYWKKPKSKKNKDKKDVLKDEMKKADVSYKSLMEIQSILKKVYKNILKKKKG